MSSIKKNSKKGSALYLAIIIISVVLMMGIALNEIAINQLNIIKGIGDSVIAFYAGEAGAEEALYVLYKNTLTRNCKWKPSWNLRPRQSRRGFTCSGVVGNASYSVSGHWSSSVQCPNPPYSYYCIRSVGKYEETKRAVEVAY